MSHPYSRRELRDVAREPRVPVILSGAGLAGHRSSIEEICRSSGPALYDILQGGGGNVSDRRANDPIRLRFVLVDDSSLGVTNLGDCNRRMVHALCGEG